MSRRSTLLTVVVLIVSLFAAGATRTLCLRQRAALDADRGRTASQGNLAQLNSFALGLFLGGLRGPLVMALWTSSENQKVDRELADIDTKIELIRLLQPEFDTVHLFQIWNKAYNLSVQMANVPNKYTTILDALEYANSVDRERPNNINIVSSIAGLYFDKFGGAAEKGYYSPRLRQETLPDVQHVRVKFPTDLRTKVLDEARLAGASNYSLNAQELPADKTAYIVLRQPTADRLKERVSDGRVTFTPTGRGILTRVDSTGRRLAHASLLDKNYNVLDIYTAPPVGKAFDKENPGELGYLTRFQPYPLGVSPYALAFNYYKQAQWLQRTLGQRHTQMSDRVISSRPGLSLTKWSEEDWFAARRSEIEMLGLPVPTEESELEAPTEAMPLDGKLPKSALLEQTLLRYDSAATTARASADEFSIHLSDYPADVTTYSSHRANATAQSHLMWADALYLRAVAASGTVKSDFAAKAREEYRTAASLYSRHILRYYTSEDLLNEARKSLMLPPMRRADVVNPSVLPESILPLILARVQQHHMRGNYKFENGDDFRLINVYVTRATARIRTINAALK